MAVCAARLVDWFIDHNEAGLALQGTNIAQEYAPVGDLAVGAEVLAHHVERIHRKNRIVRGNQPDTHWLAAKRQACLLYTSPSPRDA